MNIQAQFSHLDEGKREKLIIAVILLFTLAINLLNYVGMEVSPPALRADAEQYVKMAINIANQGVFADEVIDNKPVINRLPGYPLLLAAVWKASPSAGNFYQNILLINVLLSTLATLMLYLIARKRFNRAISGSLAILFALNPHSIALQGYALSETLFSFELLLLGWCMTLVAERKSKALWLAIGAIIGYALLTRPSFLLFLPFLAVAFYLFKPLRPQAKLLASAGLLGCALVVSPWVIYTTSNGIPFSGTKKDSITLTAGFFPNLMYKNPAYYGFPYRDPEAPPIHDDTKKALAQLWEWSKQEPLKYLNWFLIGKPITLWQWNSIQGAGEMYIYPVKKSVFKDNKFFIAEAAVYHFVYPVMLILMLIGVVVTLIRGKDLVLVSISAVLIYFVCIHIVFVSLPRYSIPLRSLMLLMDAVALQYLLSSQFRQLLENTRTRVKQRMEQWSQSRSKPQ